MNTENIQFFQFQFVTLVYSEESGWVTKKSIPHGWTLDRNILNEFTEWDEDGNLLPIESIIKKETFPQKMRKGTIYLIQKNGWFAGWLMDGKFYENWHWGVDGERLRESERFDSAEIRSALRGASFR